MNKETFNEILGSLQRRVDLCYGYLADIYNTEDLSKISLARAHALKQFCVEEETIMTKICMVDLYHIIGMGQLSPTQMMKFTYLMQQYLSYRPTIKVLAQHLNKIGELPNIPVKTRFKLLGLGDVTLTCGEGELIDEASVEDYALTKVSTPEPPEDLPFTISGNQIKVDMARLDYFVELMEGLFNTNFSVDNLRKKINNLDEYLGIRWISIELDNPNQQVFAIGNLLSKSTKNKITVYYNKQEKKL
jgi:hypothetical protein